MNLDINEEDFKIFLEVAKALNKSFGIIPILYGSLGLNRVIGEFGKANDIDILVPDEFVNKRWTKLVNFMQGLNFGLKDEHEHEFIRKGKIIAFATEDDLVEHAKVDPRNLKISEKSSESSLKSFLRSNILLYINLCFGISIVKKNEARQTPKKSH